MAEQSYKEKFQKDEDRVEANSYLIWRRFDRLGLNVAVLSLNFPLADPIGGSKPYKKIVYREFSGQEFGVIQLGRIVSLKEGGLTPEHDERYRVLRDFLLGRLIILDYIDARNNHGIFTPDDILRTAVKQGRFSRDFYISELLFAGMMFDVERSEPAVASLMKMLEETDSDITVREFEARMAEVLERQKCRETKQELDTKLPENLETFLTSVKNSCPHILNLVDIDKIDRYLVSRL